MINGCNKMYFQKMSCRDYICMTPGFQSGDLVKIRWDGYEKRDYIKNKIEIC